MNWENNIYRCCKSILFAVDMVKKPVTILPFKLITTFRDKLLTHTGIL